MKKVLVMLLGVAFAMCAWANPSVVIQNPVEGEFLGFVDSFGFSLPLLLGASDEDFNNPDGFAVKVESGGHTLYDKPDILFRKDYPTDLEINEGYGYDPDNLVQTATITVTTPDGRVTTRTFTFGVLPYGGVLVGNLGEINAAINTAKEEEWYDLVFVKTNDISFVSGEKIALPTLEEDSKIYFAGDGLMDVSAIVPTFGTPYDVVMNFATNNFVEVLEEWEWDDELEKWVDVTNVYTTVEKQLAQFINTNDVAKLVYDGERQAISLIARGETEDFAWILDAATNVTAWVADSNLVINNGLASESYEIDLVALTNNVALYGYTPSSPLNAVVKVIDNGEASCKTPYRWVGGAGAYETLDAALEAGETAVLPGYEIAYEANGASGEMGNDYLAAGQDVTLSKNVFSALGYTFEGWTIGTNETMIADEATDRDFAPVDGSVTLTAKWGLDTNGVQATDFASFTNMLSQAAQQSSTLPITIGFTAGVRIPEGETVALPAGTGFNGLRYEDETTLWLEDGVLYGDALRGEVTVDALVLMQLASGGAISSFKALSEGEGGLVVTNDVVMLLGDDGVPYDAIESVLAADPRPTTVKLFEGDGYFVSYDGNGAAGEMADDKFIPTIPTNLTANAFTAVGYAFAGWTTNGVDEVAYADGAAGVDFVDVNATLALTAKWSDTGVAVADFDVLTNALVVATNQSASLPVTITLTSDVTVPQGGVITVCGSPAVSFTGEGKLDVSGVVPQFGAPVVVGEGFADDSALALFDTKGVSKLVFSEGTVFLVARGETEDFPWILGVEKGVTAWVDPIFTNLAAVVVDNGLAESCAEIDLAALTNAIALYGYTPEVTPLNALVKVVESGEMSYKVPTSWIGAEGTYETLEAALAAAETAVVPNFVIEKIPAVVAENGLGSDGLVYTAVVVNDPGNVPNAIQAVYAEGLLALATNELADVRLIVSAESPTDVAEQAGEIAAAITNDVADVAGLVVDYVDLSVFFNDVPQTTLAETMSICIPWTIDPQRDYAVARLHGGVAEKLPIGKENAVEGEYVEFSTDGLVIHTKKFSLYAIGEITPCVKVIVPTGLEGYAYVVSNLTTGVEMKTDSSVDGGVTYKLPVGAKVSITCVPEDGYVVDGDATYIIDSVIRETTLVGVVLPVAREDELLYPKGDGGRFVPAAKSVETFYGAFFGENGVEGIITLKLKKPNKRTGLFDVQATVKTLVDKLSYSYQAKKITAPEEGVLTVEMAGRSKKAREHKLVVVLDGDSLTGTFDGFAIDGARDVFVIKNHPKREALAPLVGAWTGVLAGEDEKTIGATFSVRITKAARASVKVFNAEGRAMTCSSKIEIGADGRGMVPVTVSRSSGGVRTSIGFRILFRQTAEGVVAKAVNVTPVRQWSKKAGGTSVGTLAFVCAEKLTVTVTSKQFRTDYVLKIAPTYDEVLGPTVRESLRLNTFGYITGSISWKVAYQDARGRDRVKSVSGKVTGVMVGEVGFGTVAVKIPTGEKVCINLELLRK
ncbi:MAG: InlB B-repeat-containing protein [Kiritimatiellae bacterium]|nr:InlB B-repeat-containing protein [Kiritimatiellia bacterium]